MGKLRPATFSMCRGLHPYVVSPRLPGGSGLVPGAGDRLQLPVRSPRLGSQPLTSSFREAPLLSSPGPAPEAATVSGDSPVSLSVPHRGRDHRGPRVRHQPPPTVSSRDKCMGQRVGGQQTEERWGEVRE